MFVKYNEEGNMGNISDICIDYINDIPCVDLETDENILPPVPILYLLSNKLTIGCFNIAPNDKNYNDKETLPIMCTYMQTLPSKPIIIIANVDEKYERVELEKLQVRVCRWNSQQNKWKGRGKGKLTIYHNQQTMLAKIVFIDEKHNKVRLLQYINGKTLCKYDTNDDKEFVQWHGADYSVNTFNPTIGIWGVKFINESAAKQFLDIFNGYIKGDKAKEFSIKESYFESPAQTQYPGLSSLLNIHRANCLKQKPRYINTSNNIIEYTQVMTELFVHKELNGVTWVIDSNMMNQFKNAENGEQYRSAQFSLFGNNWQLELYPNGETQECIHYVSIFLQCNNLSDECNKLGINYEISFVEANHVVHGATFYRKGHMIWGFSHAMNKQMYMNLNKLTITLKIAVTCAVENEWMIWNINGYLLDRFKNYKTSGVNSMYYFSPEIKMSGVKWSLQCYPNDYVYNGFVNIQIAPLYVTQDLDVTYCIKCENVDYKYISHDKISKYSDVLSTDSQYRINTNIFDTSKEVIIMFKISTMNRQRLYCCKSWGVWRDDLLRQSFKESQIEIKYENKSDNDKEDTASNSNVSVNIDQLLIPETEPFGINGMKWRLQANQNIIKLKLDCEHCDTKERFPIKVLQTIECKALNLCERRIIVYNAEDDEQEFCCKYDKLYLDIHEFIVIECHIQSLPMEYNATEVDDGKVFFHPVITESGQKENIYEKKNETE
eukprot:397138_1